MRLVEIFGFELEDASQAPKNLVAMDDRQNRGNLDSVWAAIDSSETEADCPSAGPKKKAAQTSP